MTALINFSKLSRLNVNIMRNQDQKSIHKIYTKIYQKTSDCLKRITFDFEFLYKFHLVLRSFYIITSSEHTNSPKNCWIRYLMKKNVDNLYICSFLSQIHSKKKMKREKIMQKSVCSMVKRLKNHVRNFIH